MTLSERNEVLQIWSPIVSRQCLLQVSWLKCIVDVCFYA